MEDFGQLNLLAIVTGVVASFLLGWLWYSPTLFGIKWAAGSKVELGSAQTMPVFAMISQLVALAFLALVIGITAEVEALITAIVAILACATFVASNGGFSQKSSYAIVVDFFYIVSAGAVMVVCQGIF